MLTPSQIMYDAGGMLVDTMGQAEVEFLAVVIIRLPHVHSPSIWKTVTRAELRDFVKVDNQVRDWLCNPFWRLNTWAFCDNGYIKGWGEDINSPGTLTEKFFDALEKRQLRLNTTA